MKSIPIGDRIFLGIAHWLALVILMLSAWSGLNLANDQRPWLNSLIPAFPGMQSVSMWHQVAAVGWLGLLVFYIYILRQRRIKTADVPHRVPVAHLRSRKQIYFFLLLMLVTGMVLLSNLAGAFTAWFRTIHFFAALGLLLCLIWHITVEWRIGAWKRISNLFFQFSLRKSTSIIATSSALFTVLILVLGTMHWWQSSRLISVPKVSGEMNIDGWADDIQWKKSSKILVNTYYGSPYDRNVPVEIRMINDGYSLYIHAKWPDPSHSRQHLPLVKTASGWKVQQQRLLAADETQYYEDKFAVMLGDQPWDALRSVFLSRREGRGGHLMPKHELVDVWHWKSVRNERFANLDDAHFGPALPPIPGQRRYAWGYASDPLIAGGFQENWAYFNADVVRPNRLPRKPEALQIFQNIDEKNPAEKSNAAPAFGLHWFETQPYTKSLDTYPVGTVMPSVVWIHPNEGDRADVRAAGVWRDGYWHLEMARNYVTGSEFDKEIKDGIYLWFATFDHSQTRHTYHLRPLKLGLEK